MANLKKGPDGHLLKSNAPHHLAKSCPDTTNLCTVECVVDPDP